ncbi:glycoside hydrolase family 20 zincin-like fold domain-containing protein [Flavobacterium piscinae]|uniref:glycoside hydrolase family 20 zincin-like fold domain-containing protein n=1 Tax=Flavobacterium piscinae TaxID=2506424 RepID=UPI002AAA7F48|nr:glycoside hydrolase family 20 zincin-like fold domain-containing protein [Flavobacterium piscinae]
MTKFFLSIFLFLSFLGYSQENLPLIPIPKQIEVTNEYFELDKNTVIFSSEINSFEAIFLKENIKMKTGLDIQITSSYPKGKSIQMSIQIPDTIGFDKEKYQVSISKNSVRFSSFSSQGIFYGIQTFYNLFLIKNLIM